MRISEPRASDLVGRDVASLALRINGATISRKYWIPSEEEKHMCLIQNGSVSCLAPPAVALGLAPLGRFAT